MAEAGTFTLGFDSASWIALSLDGATFWAASGVGTISADGHSLVAEPNAGPTLTTAVVTLAAGDYPLRVLTYKNAGQSAFTELFAAPGAQDHFSPDVFRPLTDQAQTISLHRPAGLQLVPEPSAFALGLAAVFAAGSAGICHRRPRSLRAPSAK